MIEKIAKRFFESASDGKNAYRETDGITTSLKALKAGRELGRQLLKDDLTRKGYTEKQLSEILNNLGI